MIRIVEGDSVHYYEYLGWADIEEKDLLMYMSIKTEQFPRWIDIVLKKWRDTEIFTNKTFHEHESQMFEDSLKPLIPFASRYNMNDGYIFVFGLCIKGTHILKRIK